MQLYEGEFKTKAVNDEADYFRSFLQRIEQQYNKKYYAQFFGQTFSFSIVEGTNQILQMVDLAVYQINEILKITNLENLGRFISKSMQLVHRSFSELMRLFVLYFQNQMKSMANGLNSQQKNAKHLNQYNMVIESKNFMEQKSEDAFNKPYFNLTKEIDQILKNKNIIEGKINSYAEEVLVDISKRIQSMIRIAIDFNSQRRNCDSEIQAEQELLSKFKNSYKFVQDTQKVLENRLEFSFKKIFIASSKSILQSLLKQRETDYRSRQASIPTQTQSEQLIIRRLQMQVACLHDDVARAQKNQYFAENENRGLKMKLKDLQKRKSEDQVQRLKAVDMLQQVKQKGKKQESQINRLITIVSNSSRHIVQLQNRLYIQQQSKELLAKKLSSISKYQRISIGINTIKPSKYNGSCQTQLNLLRLHDEFQSFSDIKIRPKDEQELILSDSYKDLDQKEDQAKNQYKIKQTQSVRQLSQRAEESIVIDRIQNQEQEKEFIKDRQQSLDQSKMMLITEQQSLLRRLAQDQPKYKQNKKLKNQQNLGTLRLRTNQTNLRPVSNLNIKSSRKQKISQGREDSQRRFPSYDKMIVEGQLVQNIISKQKDPKKNKDSEKAAKKGLKKSKSNFYKKATSNTFKQSKQSQKQTSITKSIFNKISNEKSQLEKETKKQSATRQNYRQVPLQSCSLKYILSVFIKKSKMNKLSQIIHSIVSLLEDNFQLLKDCQENVPQRAGSSFQIQRKSFEVPDQRKRIQTQKGLRKVRRLSNSFAQNLWKGKQNETIPQIQSQDQIKQSSTKLINYKFESLQKLQFVTKHANSSNNLQVANTLQIQYFVQLYQFLANLRKKNIRNFKIIELGFSNPPLNSIHRLIRQVQRGWQCFSRQIKNVVKEHKECGQECVHFNVLREKWGFVPKTKLIF